MTLTSRPTQTLTVTKHTWREQVDNDVNIPPPQTLSVTKQTWREQVDNDDVNIPGPPTKKKKAKTTVSLPVAWGRHWVLN